MSCSTKDNGSKLLFSTLKSSGVPSKTPAFVREKRIFSQPDPLASPSVLKNVQTRQVAPQTFCLSFAFIKQVDVFLSSSSAAEFKFQLGDL